MGTKCQDINVPSVNNDNETCDNYVDCNCVIIDSLSGELKTYFGLPDIPNLYELSTSYGLSLIDARSRIATLEANEGGGGGIGTQVNTDWNSTSGVSELLNKPDLADVATSGDYDDLTNKPTVSEAGLSGDYDDLTNKPSLGDVATSNDYDDLDNKPILSTVAGTGNYSDLLGIPSFGTAALSNDYDDLDNKPTLADVATSGDYDDLINTPSLSTVATSGDYDDLSNKPIISAAGLSGDYDDLINKPTLSTVAGTGNYTDLSNKPTLGTMAAQAATDYTTTALLADVALSNDYDDLDNKPPLSAVAISGDYDDLTNKPNIPAQVNLFEGSNIDITGTYPNLTISATGGSGSVAWDEINGDQSGINLSGFTNDLGCNCSWEDIGGRPTDLEDFDNSGIDPYIPESRIVGGSEEEPEIPMYEEGIYAATILGDSGSASVGNQPYVRIGNQVTVYVSIEAFEPIGAGVSGSIQLGLPNFGMAVAEGASAAVVHGDNVRYPTDAVSLLFVTGETDRFVFVSDEGGTSDLQATDITGSVDLQLTLTYRLNNS